jgi:hypothetical protein
LALQIRSYLEQCASQKRNAGVLADWLSGVSPRLLEHPFHR